MNDRHHYERARIIEQRYTHRHDGKDCAWVERDDVTAGTLDNGLDEEWDDVTAGTLDDGLDEELVDEFIIQVGGDSDESDHSDQSDSSDDE